MDPTLSYRRDYSPIYYIIYPKQVESQSESSPDVSVVMNDERLPSPEQVPLGMPVSIVDIGIKCLSFVPLTDRDLPVVFIYGDTLCGKCSIREKKSWDEYFVTVSKDSIEVFDEVQSWRVRESPQLYISLRPTMVWTLSRSSCRV